jgi:hypothetical protein
MGEEIAEDPAKESGDVNETTVDRSSAGRDGTGSEGSVSPR